MTVKPVLLDIGCRQGGATFGYQAAGFYVIGVDVEPQQLYVVEEFLLADGLNVLRDRSVMRRVAAIHTSWPCQGYSDTQRLRGNDHPKLIEPGRELLRATGLPYVQENVKGAPLLSPVVLCGAMFGLRTYRHRLFESNVGLSVPAHPEHIAPQVKMGRRVPDGSFYQAVGNFSDVALARDDMSVEWMTREGIRECIPPAYSFHVGVQLWAALR
jgi:DNA (cytosine-5)-methyltransferase 1